MCIAFHPEYRDNGRYFLEHEVKEDGVVKTLVVERRAAADRLHDRCFDVFVVQAQAGPATGGRGTRLMAGRFAGSGNVFRAHPGRRRPARLVRSHQQGLFSYAENRTDGADSRNFLQLRSCCGSTPGRTGTA